MEAQNALTTITQPDEKEFVQTSLRLPVDVHEAIRTAAFLARLSQQQVIIKALRASLMEAS